MLPAKKRRHHKPKRVMPSAPSPVGPVLVAADYVVGQMLLTFDQAVDVSAFDGSQIIVVDGPAGFEYVGNSASAADPESIVVNLDLAGPATGTMVLLTATGLTGIVSANDGASWAGVADVELPFP